MKIIATGDWHIRYNKPLNRTDDYLQAQQQKVETLLRAGRTESAPIIQPGDFFDTPNIQFSLLAHYVHLFREYGVKIYTIFGQHDLRYHTLHGNTPLNLLREIGVVEILTPKPTSLGIGVVAYGVSWGEEIPVVAPDPSVFKILVLHKMVIGNKKLWEQQKDFVWAHSLVTDYNYDLIIAGDNHTSFEFAAGKRVLFNCGSLMRMTVDQAEHKPHFFVFDTKSKTSVRHELPTIPFNEVMNVKKVEKEKERNINLDAFVSGLKTARDDMGMDFVREMASYVKENSIPEEIHDIIKDCMREGQ
jgi:DNA repair exonuclease SbcCD nuclease subunit